jgi:transposase
MRNIGIDISKKTIDVFFQAEVYATFPNTKKGFTALAKKLFTDDILGVESTGIYHHDLALFFIQKGIEVRELNPIMTKQFIRSTVRKKKTDKSDAKIISLLLAQGEGYPMKEEKINNPLQKILRVKRKLIQMKTSLILQEQTLKKEKDFSLIRKSLKSLIKSYDTQIRNLKTEALKFQDDSAKILESIPGISPNIAREILGEIGDSSRFKKKKEIIAYAGYDPKLKQSGTSIYVTGKLTKRGSPYLRNALYTASFANMRSNTVFSRYYNKKKDEGKHHYQAMTATSRKMLEIIFSLLRKKEEFSLVFS